MRSILEALSSDVDVNLGGGDGAVAEELLDLGEGAAGLDQGRGVGVAELVGGELLPVLEPGAAGDPLQHRLHGAGREGLALPRSRGAAPDVGAHRASFEVPVLEQPVGGLLGVGERSATRSLFPLARGDGVGHAVQSGEVLVGERECPGEAKAGPVQERKEGPVAEPLRGEAALLRVEEPATCRGSEVSREPPRESVVAGVACRRVSRG